MFRDYTIVITKSFLAFLFVATNVVLATILFFEIAKQSATPRFISSGDGKCRLIIEESYDSVGLWATKPGDKSYAYIFAGRGFSPYIALGDGSRCDPLAFYLENGQPMMQLKTPTGWVAVRLSDLLRISPRPIGEDMTNKPARGFLPHDN